MQIMLKNKVADEHLSSDKNLKMTIKCKCTQKITDHATKHPVHCTCRLQAVIKNKSGHTKY